MKTLPFLALFAVLVFSSSYVSSKIDTPAAKTSLFKKFWAQRQGTDVSLSWSVASTAVSEFAIERSYDGAHFEAIGSLPCNGTALHHYNDVSVSPGTIYYRVHAIKKDESLETSLAQVVRMQKRP